MGTKLKRRVVGALLAVVAVPIGTIEGKAAAGYEGYVTYSDGNFYALDLGTGNTVELGAIDTTDPVSGMTQASDGKIFAIDQASAIYEIDPNTGTPTQAAPLPTLNQAFWDGIASHRLGNIYAVVNYSTGPVGGTQTYGLWQTHPSSWQMNFVGPTGQPSDWILSLAGGCNGKFYGVKVGSPVDLVEMNITNGSYTFIGSISSPLIDGDDSVEIAFQHATNTLWALTNDRDLLKINPATAAVMTGGPGAIQDQSSATTDALVFDSIAQCRYGRKLTLVYRSGAFRGRLTSAFPHCFANKRITIYRSRPGPDRVIGSDQTNSTGRFVESRTRRPGSYYAVAGRTSSASGICLRVRSTTLKLG